MLVSVKMYVLGPTPRSYNILAEKALTMAFDLKKWRTQFHNRNLTISALPFPRDQHSRVAPGGDHPAYMLSPAACRCKKFSGESSSDANNFDIGGRVYFLLLDGWRNKAAAECKPTARALQRLRRRDTLNPPRHSDAHAGDAAAAVDGEDCEAPQGRQQLPQSTPDPAHPLLFRFFVGTLVSPPEGAGHVHS